MELGRLDDPIVRQQCVELRLLNSLRGKLFLACLGGFGLSLLLL